MDGQDFPGPQLGDGGRVGDGEDFSSCEGDADAEVVHAVGSADADLAAGVDVVVAEPVVAGRSAAGPGLRPGPVVGLAGGGALHCPVRPVLVVVPAEGAGLVLQPGQGGSGRLRAGPLFPGLVESPGLALSLGRFGLPFFWVTRRLCR